MEAFIDSTLSKNVLFYGTVDEESVEFGCVGRRGWFPTGWGNDLDDKNRRIKTDNVCYKNSTFTMP
jgi:hypothetical protein